MLTYQLQTKKYLLNNKSKKLIYYHSKTKIIIINELYRKNRKNI